MNKFKKYLIVLSCLIIVFSLVCMPVFAVSVSHSFRFDFPLSKPNVSDNFGFIEVVGEDSNGNLKAWIIFVSFFSTDGSTPSPFCNVTFPQSNSIGNAQKIRLSDRQGTTALSCCQYSSDSGVTPLGTSALNNYVDLDFQWYEICSLRFYGSFTVDSNYLGNYNTIDSIFCYGSEAISVSLLSAILTILEQQGNHDVVNAINNQTNKLQDNQNSNAQDIQDNADENTDKILNGWESDVEVESGDTGSLEDSEQDFIANNQHAADSEVSAATDNIFSSVRRLASSFGAIGSMFRQLTVRVPDFNVFIYFSLVIGIVPLIVGMSLNGLRARDRASARQRQEIAYKRGYNSGYTKGRGG